MPPRTRRHLALLALTPVLLPPAARAQGAPAGCRVEVRGGKAPLVVTADSLARWTRTRVTAAEHGREVTFEGVLAREVLARAGALGPGATHGEVARTIVVARAADGYRTVFALAEFDPAFRERAILLADRRDGAALDAREGPCRLVVPDEQRGARAIRQLTALELHPAP